MRSFQNFLIVFLGLIQLIASLNSAPSKAGVASQINPKTYFKPDLRRVEKQRTGIIFRVLSPRALQRTINNPFLSNQLPSNSPFEPLTQYEVLTEDRVFHSNPYGKINLVPMRPGFKHFKVQSKSLISDLFLTLPHAKVILIQVTRFGPRPGLPETIVSMGELKRLENPELNKLQREAIQVYSHLESFISGSLDPLEFVNLDYRDEVGGHRDFSKYLRILYRKLRGCKITKVELNRIKTGKMLSFSGRVQWQGKSWEPFFLRLQTDEDLKILRYDLDKPSPQI